MEVPYFSRSNITPRVIDVEEGNPSYVECPWLYLTPYIYDYMGHDHNMRQLRTCPPILVQPCALIQSIHGVARLPSADLHVADVIGSVAMAHYTPLHKSQGFCALIPTMCPWEAKAHG